jgi:hypothetical protein
VPYSGFKTRQRARDVAVQVYSTCTSLISHTKCLLPTACTVCTALTDHDGCNPVVEAKLPALLSLIIAQFRSRQSLGCRYFARPAICLPSLLVSGRPINARPHTTTTASINQQSSINHLTKCVCQHHHA